MAKDPGDPLELPLVTELGISAHKAEKMVNATVRNPHKMQKSSSQIMPWTNAAPGMVIVKPSGFCRRPIRLAGGLYRSHTSSAEA